MGTCIVFDLCLIHPKYLPNILDTMLALSY